MKRGLFRVLLSTNALLTCLLFIAYLSPLFPPDDWWMFTFIGTGTTYLLAVHLLLALCWIPFSFGGTAANIFLICLGFNFLSDTLQWNYPDTRTDKDLRVISINVGVFSYKKENARSLLNKLLKQQPDVLCIQEFYAVPGFDAIRYIESNSALDHHAFYPVDENYGLIIFSRFPITRSERMRFPLDNLGTNGCLYADLSVGKRKVRFYNTHLSSMRIQKHLKELYNAGSAGIIQEQDDVYDVVRKMRSSWKKQVPMCELLKTHMEESPHPVILCGDMNSTPYGYIVRRLSDGLQDTYRAKGSGLGFTFRSNFPLLRIDYIFVPENYRVLKHEIPRMLESDHFPVVADLALPE